LPAAAALAGIALSDAEPGKARAWLAACSLLLVAFPMAGQVLPSALLTGLSRAPTPAFHPLWLAPAALAVSAWLLETRGRRLAAVLVVAAGAGLGIAGLKALVAPELDRSVSARGLWRQIEDRPGDVCLGQLKRDWVYGLNYYAGRALPNCTDEAKPLRVQPAPEGRATLVR
jgi:hypothetical protein